MSEKVFEQCAHDLPIAGNAVGETWRCGLCGLFFTPDKATTLSDWRWWQRTTKTVLEEIAMMKAVRGE